MSEPVPVIILLNVDDNPLSFFKIILFDPTFIIVKILPTFLYGLKIPVMFIAAFEDNLHNDASLGE